MLHRLKNLFASERKSISLPPELLLSMYTNSAAGITVSPETAMRCPAVYASVKVLSEAVAQLPLHVYRRDDDGGRERAPDHPLYELLHDQANDWTSAYEFRLGMQSALCLHKGAFAFINRAGGVVRELIQIPSQSVVVETDPVTLEPTYKVTGSNGEQKTYHRNEILHLRNLGDLSPVEQAREAIGLSIAMEKHASLIFGRGARPSGVLKMTGRLTDEQLTQLKGSFDSVYGGSGGPRSGGTLILEEGMSFEPHMLTSVDLQFLELRRHQVAEIARIFRIPLHMLQELERTTHHNAEEMGRQFLSFTLLPWLKMWEGAIRRSLLTKDERKSYFAEFLTDDLARADLQARFEAYSKAVTNGILSPNEIGQSENRPPYEGGDEYRVAMNTEPPGQGKEGDSNGTA